MEFKQIIGEILALDTIIKDKTILELIRLKIKLIKAERDL